MIEIQLSQGKVAIVDDCDSEIANLGWYAAKRGALFYAVRHKPRCLGHGIVYLHRLVIDAPNGMEVAAAIRLHGEFAWLNFHGPIILWNGAA